MTVRCFAEILFTLPQMDRSDESTESGEARWEEIWPGRSSGVLSAYLLLGPLTVPSPYSPSCRLKTHPSRFLLSPRLLITTEVCGSTLWLGVPLTNGILWYLARDCIYHDQWQRVRKCCKHDQRELAVSTCLRFTHSLWSISEGMIFSYLLHCCNRLCTFQLMEFSWWTKNFALCSSFKQVSVCV